MKSGENQSPRVYTVSELNKLVQKSLEEKFPELWIEGEVSNFRGVSGSGHCYFSLKDESAQVDIVAFRGVMSALKFELEDGLKLLICGRVSLYLQRGRFQVIAVFIEPRGAGALQLAFEQLKKKLEGEGLFDPGRKKPIPSLPQKIGIVTSPTGAAIRDILTVINRRFSNVEILIYPVKVQGESAKEEIAEAIRYFNETYPHFDVLLVGRGGGSIEDLWAFNEEIVARAIAASKIPVISCVGHEIDFTIADFVADLRAATPSAAAELVVKNKTELVSALKNNFVRLRHHLHAAVSRVEEQLKGLARSPVFTEPQRIFEDDSQKLDEFAGKMDHSIEKLTEMFRSQLEVLKSKIFLLSPEFVLEERRKYLQPQIERLNNAAAQRVQHLRETLKSHAWRLEALSPLAVLSRGYSISWVLPEMKILKSALQVSKEDLIRIKLNQGEIKALVQETVVHGGELSGKKSEKSELPVTLGSDTLF